MSSRVCSWRLKSPPAVTAEFVACYASRQATSLSMAPLLPGHRPGRAGNLPSPAPTHVNASHAGRAGATHVRGFRKPCAHIRATAMHQKGEGPMRLTRRQFIELTAGAGAATLVSWRPAYAFYQSPGNPIPGQGWPGIAKYATSLRGVGPGGIPVALSDGASAIRRRRTLLSEGRRVHRSTASGARTDDAVGLQSIAVALARRPSPRGTSGASSSPTRARPLT